MCIWLVPENFSLVSSYCTCCIYTLHAFNRVFLTPHPTSDPINWQFKRRFPQDCRSLRLYWPLTPLSVLPMEMQTYASCFRYAYSALSKIIFRILLKINNRIFFKYNIIFLYSRVGEFNSIEHLIETDRS